jgi:DNA-binding MarR family transcriptional regulator
MSETTEAKPAKAGKKAKTTATPTDPGAALEGLIRLSHRFATSLTDADVFTKRTLSVAEWSVLAAVKENPSAAVGKLAKASGISRQRTRQLLNALEAAKLVDVTRSEQDKRGRAVMLTGQGEDALSGVRADLAAAAGDAMDDSALKMVRRVERLFKKLSTKLLPKEEKAEGEEAEAEG